jgi:hypothetical protein
MCIKSYGRNKFPQLEFESVSLDIKPLEHSNCSKQEQCYTCAVIHVISSSHPLRATHDFHLHERKWRGLGGPAMSSDFRVKCSLAITLCLCSKLV